MKEFVYLSLHDYLYINNACWITKSSDKLDQISVDSRPSAMTLRYKDTKV